MVKTIILKVYSEDSMHGARVFENVPMTVGEFANRIRESGGTELNIDFKCGADPGDTQEVTGKLIELDADIPERVWDKVMYHVANPHEAKNESCYWVEVKTDIS